MPGRVRAGATPMRYPAAPAVAVLAGVLAATVASCGEGPTRRPDIALVIIDTLRADALSCYGNARATTPHLDRLAERGVLFERVLAQAPNTATSHATLFTGLEPWVHRVANVTSLQYGTPGLDDEFVTLAERLAAVGYRTAAFTDDGPLGRGWNLMQGFERLEAALEGVSAKVDDAIAWLDEAHGDAPLFFLLHTYEVHQPFVPPADVLARFDPDYEGPLVERVAHLRALRERGELPNDGLYLLKDVESFTPRDLEHLRALYDAEVAHTDAELARLWAALEDRGRFDAMAIAVTSDHGEEFGEHGKFGHWQLHDETLHVPLILKLPDGRHAGVRVAHRLPLVDLHPTLLELADAPPTAGSRAESLLAPLVEGAWRDRAVRAQTTEHLYEPLHHVPWLTSTRRGPYALLADRRAGPDGPASSPWRAALYDVRSDPGEHAPVAELGGDGELGTPIEQRRALAFLDEMRAELAALEASRGALLRDGGGLLPGSAELERQHAALGYTGGD